MDQSVHKSDNLPQILTYYFVPQVKLEVEDEEIGEALWRSEPASSIYIKRNRLGITNFFFSILE